MTKTMSDQHHLTMTEFLFGSRFGLGLPTSLAAVTKSKQCLWFQATSPGGGAKIFEERPWLSNEEAVAWPTWSWASNIHKPK